MTFSPAGSPNRIVEFRHSREKPRDRLLSAVADTSLKDLCTNYSIHELWNLSMAFRNNSLDFFSRFGIHKKRAQVRRAGEARDKCFDVFF